MEDLKYFNYIVKKAKTLAVANNLEKERDLIHHCSKRINSTYNSKLLLFEEMRKIEKKVDKECFPIMYQKQLEKKRQQEDREKLKYKRKSRQGICFYKICR
ncbi:unnamed protein product [Moneuplotes crassus]|uniref:Uncharacterized protein n=1 Tax=Euplotes crassus TaxID=5936 RepID=A0AAD1XYJ9_EUPCR|nr:unnamed protein product [Moneuplotes crassus]